MPLDAAERLAAVLARENAALAALDFVGAAALLAEKAEAAAGLASLASALPAPGPLPEGTGHRLGDLAEENRRLLERAIMVQGRIVGIIARALEASSRSPRYGATGAAAGGRTGAYALSARA